MHTITFGYFDNTQSIPQENLEALAELVESFNGQCGFTEPNALVAQFNNEQDAAEFITEFHRRTKTIIN